MSSKRRTTPESQANKDAADKNTTDKNVVDNNAAVKNAADNIADKKAADNNAAYKNIADKNVADKKSLFVFGYGSLLWYTDFDYDTCTAGYINGFVRRFWQQSETHRGTPERVGTSYKKKMKQNSGNFLLLLLSFLSFIATKVSGEYSKITTSDLYIKRTILNSIKWLHH